MKRSKILVIFVMFITIFICGCSNKGYVEVSYEKLNKMVDDKKTFALFIGKKTCTACDAFKVILNDSYKKYAKEFPIYYIDLDKLTTEEKVKFNATYNFSGTPTVVVIENGAFSNSNVCLQGADEYSSMIEKFKDKGYIKR